MAVTTLRAGQRGPQFRRRHGRFAAAGVETGGCAAFAGMSRELSDLFAVKLIDTSTVERALPHPMNINHP